MVPRGFGGRHIPGQSGRRWWYHEARREVLDVGDGVAIQDSGMVWCLVVAALLGHHVQERESVAGGRADDA